ncbi:MAG: 4Fe-4S dicluster domain-containing protein [Candidatus Shikimatogenerans bostrichidophilus]|nr:MAG: 4Fe-4S dicluster domain-containing protein [Candidatus Shikimatogenerans bostrichidophilus]
MSLKITKECINCGACELECPNKAIYEGGKNWSLSDGTSIKNLFIYNKGKKIYKDKKYKYLSKKKYYIVKEKCTECIGFFKYPQCASVCPVDCCIKDKKNKESIKELLLKQKLLHPNT